jgi:hypothetical protein
MSISSGYIETCGWEFVVKIFLMCQGRGSRWTENARFDVPSDLKQLVPINGEPLISRTLKQLSGVPNVTLVGHGTDFRQYHHCIRTFRDPVGSLVEGILRTSTDWEDSDHDILYLLGDVVYSNYAISVILSNLYVTRPVTLYGRLSGNLYTGKMAREIFAIHIDHDDDVYKMLKYIDDEKGLQSKLWDIYHQTNRIVPIADWTDDVDSPEEYHLFFKKLERYAANENR